jgi:D-arabinose 1-dehydrogenase-like Zn-dependent alcohol dehydrogenase
LYETARLAEISHMFETMHKGKIEGRVVLGLMA